MIDTHTHVVSKKIKSILAASDIDDSKENIDKAKKNANIWAAVGIHPQTKIENVDKSINCLDKLIEENKEWIVVVGECGLDYSDDKKDQEKLFRGQIALADKYKLPLMVHARKAVDEVISILKDYPKVFGVFHCWAGGVKRISKVEELGDNWYFGIDGNLTYEVGLEQVVKKIAKEKLVLETDSPFLTPVPHRGKVNKPEYVKFVYEKVAEIWQMSFEETEKMIDENVERLFGLSVFGQN